MMFLYQLTDACFRGNSVCVGVCVTMVIVCVGCVIVVTRYVCLCYRSNRVCVGVCYYGNRVCVPVLPW